MNRVVLITGSTRGIGYYTGARRACWSRRERKYPEYISEYLPEDLSV